MVDGAPHVGQVGFTPRLDSAAWQCGRQAGTQRQQPATTFDAPLAPEANEITAGGMELTLSLTDLQIPTG